MNIALLDDSTSSQYEEFLLASDTTLLYASDKYRQLLRCVLGAADRYLIAQDKQDNMVGALPAFLSKSEALGSVLNSLPFFGSHGGVIEHRGDETVRRLLLASYADLAAEEGCVATTLIASPFEPTNRAASWPVPHTFTDQRVGQLKRLGSLVGNADDALFATYHKARRTDLRKARRIGIKVHCDSSLASLEFLSETHLQSMKRIGGLPKPPEFFRKIPDFFKPDVDYLVWTATLDEQPIAALLVFYFNRVAEYFTPVTLQGFREFQPLSALIHAALKDAASRGFWWWNFGGTWPPQQGVYSFKSRWGVEDRPYTYYVTVRDQSILHHSRYDLLDAFPYFFVVPFERLLE